MKCGRRGRIRFRSRGWFVVFGKVLGGEGIARVRVTGRAYLPHHSSPTPSPLSPRSVQTAAMATTAPAPLTSAPAPTRWLWYGVLVIVVCSMSWGGPIFGLLVDTPPMLKAGWRLTLMTLLMTPLALWDWRGLADKPHVKAAWWRSIPSLLLSGVSLGLHFCCFAYSVDTTLFSHAMLLVQITPMVLVSWAAALFVAHFVLQARLGRAYRDAAVLLTFTPQPLQSADGGGDGGDAAHRGTFAAELASLQSAHRADSGGSSVDAVAPDLRAVRSVTVLDDKVGPDGPVCGDAAPLGGDGGAGALVGSHANGRADVSSAAWAGTIRLSEHQVLSPSAPPASSGRTSPVPPHPLRTLVARLAGTVDAPLLPTLLEVLGSCVALAGMVVLILVREQQQQQQQQERSAASPSLMKSWSLAGDIASFAACIALAVYILVGARLRKWMPLWAYMAPVSAVSAVVATAASLALEDGVCWVGCGPRSVVGWLATGRDFGLTLAAAVVPGMMGHALANAVLAHLSPLVLSAAQLAQPLIAGLYGYGLGLQGDPGLVTVAVAPVLLVGVLCVVVGKRGGPVHAWVNKRLGWRG